MLAALHKLGVGSWRVTMFSLKSAVETTNLESYQGVMDYSRDDSPNDKAIN